MCVPGARTFGLPFLATVFFRVVTRLCLPATGYSRFSFPPCMSVIMSFWFSIWFCSILFKWKTFRTEQFIQCLVKHKCVTFNLKPHLSFLNCNIAVGSISLMKPFYITDAQQENVRRVSLRHQTDSCRNPVHILSTSTTQNVT